MFRLTRVIGAISFVALALIGTSVALPAQAQPDRLGGGGACKNQIPYPMSATPGDRANIVVAAVSGNTVDVTAHAPANPINAVMNGRVSETRLNTYGQYAIASDGRLGSWYGQTTTPAPKTIDIEAIGEGQCASVNIPAGSIAFDAVFLDNTSKLPQWMAYVLADGNKQTWILGLVDVYTHEYVEFSAGYQTSGDKIPAVGFVGIADVLGWNAATKTLFLSSYIPYTDRQAHRAVYTLDLSKQPLDSTRHPFPPAKLLLERENGLNVQLSPDGTKLAYMLSDPNKPPTGYKPFDGPSGSGAAPTGLADVDMAGGMPIAVGLDSLAHGFGAYTWTLNGTAILFTTGVYKQTYALTSPSLDRLDMVKGESAFGDLLISDPGQTVIEMRACSHAVYFTVANLSQSGKMTLLTADNTVPILTADNIRLLNCIPG